MARKRNRFTVREAKEAAKHIPQSYRGVDDVQEICKCKCGGTVFGVNGFGHCFTFCSLCTPVVKVSLVRLAQTGK